MSAHDYTGRGREGGREGKKERGKAEGSALSGVRESETEADRVRYRLIGETDELVGERVQADGERCSSGVCSRPVRS